MPDLQKIDFALSDPPEGFPLSETTVGSGKVTLQLHAESGKVKTGLRGNLIVDASIEQEMPARKEGSQGRTARIPLGVLPAIPFEVVDEAERHQHFPCFALNHRRKAPLYPSVPSP